VDIISTVYRGTCRGLLESRFHHDVGYFLPSVVVIKGDGMEADTLEVFNSNLHTGLLDRLHACWAGELDTWGVEVIVTYSSLLGADVVIVTMTGTWDGEGEVAYDVL
tara:strand:- start:380 stop:700 length:321 start_codon:yes stop_codon:yes gene_type:complete